MTVERVHGAYTAYFDGSCGPGERPIATYGYVVYGPHGELYARGSGAALSHLGTPTVNVAEYTGLLRVLEVVPNNKSGVVVRGDSQLVIYQLLGTYRLRAEKLRPLYERCRALLRAEIKLEWVPRERNTEADSLAGALYTLLRDSRQPE